MATYSKEPPMGSSKRLFVAASDSAILIVLSFLLMLLINSAILPSFKSFSNNLKTLDDERLACLKISEESGLNEFIEVNGEKVYDANHTQGTEYLFKKYIRSHMLLAYQKNPDSFAGVDLTPMSGYEEGIASFDNDLFAKFYVNYCSQYNTYEGKENDLVDLIIPGQTEKATFKQYFAYVLRNKTKYDPGEAYANIWVNAESIEKDEYVYMNGDFAKNLYVGIEFDQDNTALIKYYNVIRMGFENLYNYASDTLTKSTRYSAHFDNYLSTYYSCTVAYDLGALLSYSFAFLLTFILPGLLLLKKGTSFALYLFKGRIIDNEGQELRWQQLLIRYIIMFFTYFGTLVISSFFAGGLITALMYPLFTLGTLNISLFHISVLFLFIGLVNALIMAFTYNHHSVVEMASNTSIVDIKDYDPNMIVKDDTNLVGETGSQRVSDTGDYFDSSCFDNTERRKK